MAVITVKTIEWLSMAVQTLKASKEHKETSVNETTFRCRYVKASLFDFTDN